MMLRQFAHQPGSAGRHCLYRQSQAAPPRAAHGLWGNGVNQGALPLGLRAAAKPVCPVDAQPAGIRAVRAKETRDSG